MSSEVVSLLAGSSLRFSPLELAARVKGRIFSLDQHVEGADGHYRTRVAGFNPSYLFPVEDDPDFTPANYDDITAS